jgi:hypothetical protein
MFKVRSLNRFHASGIHLFISAFVVGTSALFVFMYWYPDLLGYASGVRDIFLILVLVDVILGPLITLIVFNLEKKELKWDLGIVGSIQLMALIYGLNTLFEARPVFIVFNNDRFDVVYANELTEDKMKNVTLNEFKSLPFWGPKVIGANLPEDQEKAKDIVFSAVSGGDDVQQMPEYYLPYVALKSSVSKAAKPLEQIRDFNKNKIKDVNQLIERFSLQSDKIGYIPLVGKVKKLVVVVNRETAEILTMSKLSPWDDSYGVSSVDLKSALKKSN